LSDSILVEGLTKRFGNFIAVDNVSFSVREGEFFGLLGPNGAGKTTIIRMLTGVLEPDAGRVAIGGIDIGKEPLAAKERMGAIPEVGTVYLDLTARENLDLFGRYYGLPKALRTERGERMLAELGLKDRADSPVKNFSKGMKQRVSIGCAMVHEPRILLLDEPTEGLDVQSRRMIVEKVKELNAKGSTVILTTHNIAEASRLCQRVCIIDRGKIVAIDSPEHLRFTMEKMQSVEVAFSRRVDPSLLSDPCISRVEEQGDKLKVFTSDPDKAVEKVMAVKRELGLSIVSISTAGPTLEDVFVKLTEARR
jgi:ABC-2 type transport system ATP-binding protein